MIWWLGYEKGECQKRIEVGERACIDAEDQTDMKEQGHLGLCNRAVQLCIVFWIPQGASATKQEVV